MYSLPIRTIPFSNAVLLMTETISIDILNSIETLRPSRVKNTWREKKPRGYCGFISVILFAELLRATFIVQTWTCHTYFFMKLSVILFQNVRHYSFIWILAKVTSFLLLSSNHPFIGPKGKNGTCSILQPGNICSKKRWNSNEVLVMKESLKHSEGFEVFWN